MFEGLSVTKVVKNERARERALLIEIHFNLYKVRFVVFVTVFMPLPVLLKYIILVRTLFILFYHSDFSFCKPIL